jgi:pimeloyl-ACP methyl ester carboxylesterase
VTATDWTTDANGTGQYAEVNGINLYFETHGAGWPLILLHGGLGSGEMFRPVLPALAERHQVIAVDCRGTAGPPTSIDRSTSGSWPVTSRRSSNTSGWTGRTWWLLTRRWGGAPGSGELHGHGRPAGRGLSQHPARRDLSGHARAAGPGERGRRRVHEGHTDVPALPAGGAASRGLPSAAGQDG